MRKNVLFVFSLSVIVLLLSAMAFAQETSRTSTTGSKYVISAEAGGVNYVEGKVLVVRKNDTSGYLLKGDNVSIGEEVTTGADGKTELLLNPGSYVRLGGNSSFEFVNTSLEDLQLKLNRGSAMFEVITTDDFSFTVKTPKADFNIVKSGVYRVDVLEDGTGKIEVRKGRAQIGDEEDGKVKKGRSAIVDGDDIDIAKFDRDDRDSLEEWSKSRSKEISKVNSRLQRDRLRNSLISTFGSRWNLYDSFGVWVYDPFWGGYSFLPFGYGWYSPYGYRFRRDLWYCRLPRYIYTQPPPRQNTTRRRPSLNTNTRTSNAGNTSPNTTRRTPVFQRANNGTTRATPTTRSTSPTIMRRPQQVIVPRRSAPTLNKQKP